MLRVILWFEARRRFRNTASGMSAAAATVDTATATMATMGVEAEVDPCSEGMVVDSSVPPLGVGAGKGASVADVTSH